MASGVVAALTAQGMAGIPVGGQDGDLAAINRVALGNTDRISLEERKGSWQGCRRSCKRARRWHPDGQIAGVGKFADGKNKVEMNAILLEPTPITKANINVAIDAGHITKEQACAGRCCRRGSRLLTLSID